MAMELLDAAAVSAALADLRPSAIYHLAGSAHVADSWSHTRETFEGNVLATHHLLQGLHRHGLRPRVLVSGSATIYAAVGPADHGELAARARQPVCHEQAGAGDAGGAGLAEQGIPVVLARSFNHVGPRQTPSYVAPSIARQVALIERGALPPVLKMGNLDPERDVMDVRDTVRAYRAMMAAAAPGVRYNVCGGRPIRIGDLVDLFRARARVPIEIEQDPARMRPSDVPRLAGSHAKLTTDTGWQPEIPLEQTVDDLLAWWQTQIELQIKAEQGRR
jgi:GDP-4-dehydro-6-deoxy-D-mannose reductase